MSAVARRLVDVAIALSPEPHRQVRREQWQADLAGAEELDMSAGALAFGALTTALFHRRSVHRSTWGDTMTVAPTETPSEPHTIRTVPVLVITAILSLLASGVWFILQPNYGYPDALELWIGTAGVWSLLYIVPGAAITLAVLLQRDGDGRTRRIGASMVAAAALGAIVYPYVTPSTGIPVEVIPPTVALAGWLVATRVRGWRWASIVLLPAVAITLMDSGVVYAILPERLTPFVIAMPSLGAILAGLVVTSLERGSVASPAGPGTASEGSC